MEVKFLKCLDEDSRAEESNEGFSSANDEGQEERY